MHNIAGNAAYASMTNAKGSKARKRADTLLEIDKMHACLHLRWQVSLSECAASSL